MTKPARDATLPYRYRNNQTPSTNKMSTPVKPARTGGKRTRTKNAKTAAGQADNITTPETIRLHMPEPAMPDFCGKRVLDMGCRDGWHCRYAIEHGAIACTGIDASEPHIRQALRHNASFWTEYRCAPLENPGLKPQTCDIALCAYALDEHPDPQTVLAHIHRSLIPGGTLVLCARHPLHTATGTPDTATDNNDTSAATLFARYFDESERAPAKGKPAPCRHRTTATLVNRVIAAGFTLTGPSEHAPVPAHTDDTQTPVPASPAALVITAKRTG